MLEAGHAGYRLADFTESVDAKLEPYKHTVQPAQVLAVRLYTTSSFRRFNKALRDKGSSLRGNGPDKDMPFRACVQSARSCLLTMEKIERPSKAECVSTFRGVTGYLGRAFSFGMDYAFFSTSANETVAVDDFARSVPKSVIFVVEYDVACHGADISLVSVYPGEMEVLFPPCTGLSLKQSHSSPESGHARVTVSVRPAPSRLR